MSALRAITDAARAALESLGDGEWHETTTCSSGVWRRLDKLGLIERRLARGNWYGINHPTQARITDTGWAALAAGKTPTINP